MHIIKILCFYYAIKLNILLFIWKYCKASPLQMGIKCFKLIYVTSLFTYVNRNLNSSEEKSIEILNSITTENYM